MTPTPPVSIVIPTRDRAAWLRTAIESVLGQDYPDLELVVIDDGSADETPALLADYAARMPERRFRFLSQENAGQARSLNRGNALARGELLGYLSDDDRLAPGAVSRLARELGADSSLAVAYPGYTVIDADDEVKDVVRPIRYSPVEAARLHDTVIGPGGLVRREALEAAGGWDPGLRWMGDMIMWLGVGLQGGAVRVDEPLAYWRAHSGSATLGMSVAHAREHLIVAERALEMLGAEATPEVRAEAVRNAALFAAIFAGGSAWPADRYKLFDLHRKSISSFASGQGAGGEIDWAIADEAAALYRELVALAPRPPTGPLPPEGGEGGGLAGARERLRAVGGLPREDGTYAEAGDEAALRLGLIEAAIECGSEIDPARARFWVCDLSLEAIGPKRLEQLTKLGFGVRVARLRAIVENWRRPTRPVAKA